MKKTNYSSILLAGLLVVGVSTAQAESQAPTSSPTPSMDRRAPQAIPPSMPDNSNSTWSAPERDKNGNPSVEQPGAPSGDLENPAESSGTLDDEMDGTENDGSN
jgi:hypothetical protein